MSSSLNEEVYVNNDLMWLERKSKNMIFQKDEKTDEWGYRMLGELAAL